MSHSDSARRIGSRFHPLSAAAIAVLAAASSVGAALQVHSSSRYLVEADGTPFFLTGDAAWSLIAEPSLAEATLYLDDRAEKGFNLLMVNLIEHAFSSHPPANANGDPPFTGTPFTTPNELYFLHADEVIARAGERGIQVLLAPVYLGYGCGSEGWCAEVQAASLADMRAWGRYLGQRYASYDNIVWLIGGDTDPSPVADKLLEVVAGIREFDTVHLMTAHNQPETEAVTPWPGEDWVAVNSVYTYSNILYEAVQDAYERTPPLPVFLLEAAYENEHGSTAQSLRAQSYWAALSGAFGHVFGNCPIWHFGYSSSWCGLDDWQAELDESGSTNMEHYRRLFESRRWTALVPDFAHEVLTAGYGTPSTTSYATAASSADGSSIIAYLPSQRTVSIDMSTLTGSTIRAWWYLPATGAASEIGLFPRLARDFTPPFQGDWVLVVDDAEIGFPAPGVPLTPVVAPEPVSNSMPSSLRVEPNPFHDLATVRYEVAVATAVSVQVVAVDGRIVRELFRGAQTAGSHELTWDGLGEGGRTLPSGTYYVRMETGGFGVTQRVVQIQ